MVPARFRLPDPAVLWTMAGRVASAVGGLAAIPLVISCLSQQEQGLFYVFASLLAVQTVAELGFSTVAIQRLSAAVSRADGAEGGLGGIAALLRLTLRWYLWSSTALLLILLPGGWLFLDLFVSGMPPDGWSGPWLLLASSTCCWLLASGWSVAGEGLGRIAAATRARAVGAIVRSALLCLLLVLDAGLWAPGVATLAGTAALLAALLPEPARSLRRSLAGTGGEPVRFRRDIWPFQWRIALSWVSGFFIYQFMVLAVAAGIGTVAAGQFGVAQAVAAGIGSIASSALSPRQATWAAMAAVRDFAALDASFRASLRTAVVLATLGSLAAFAVAWAVSSWHQDMAARLPDLATWALLLLAPIANQYVTAAATYLRAHGREPFLPASITFALTMLLLSIPASRLGLAVLAGVYLAATLLFGCAWGWRLMRIARNSWHA